MKKTISFFVAILACILMPITSLAMHSDITKKRIGTVSGQIFIDGNSSAFVLVAFFLKEKGLPPIADGLRRVPDFISRTDVYGKFKVTASPGDYYVGALIRDPGAAPGPPAKGEAFYFFRKNKGELGLVSVKLYEQISLGRLDVDSADTFIDNEEFFTIEGVVSDRHGTPISGVVVLGKSQLNIPRPEFISERTDKDGFYRLKLPAHKSFYLVSRETIAGARPKPGTLIGTYGIESKSGLATPSIFGSGSPPPGVVNHEVSSQALTVAGGPGEKNSNVNIFMYMVPDPENIKASIQGTINAPKFEKGAEINNISFAPNSFTLFNESFKELDLWVDFLKGLQTVNIELQGHTDNIGTLSYNARLSKNRAQAVANYLITKGVEKSRLRVKGFGSDRPIATNDTPEGRIMNRRVEIKFLD